MQRGDIDALIYERAVLGYMIQHYGWRDLQVLPHTLAVHDYAIALPAGSPIKEEINRALLRAVPSAGLEGCGAALCRSNGSGCDSRSGLALGATSHSKPARCIG